MKKCVLNIILAVLFCTAIFAAPALFFLLPRQDFSEREKRYLAEAPTLNGESLADGTFMTETEDFVTDHFPGRELFVGINAYYDLFSGRQSTKDYLLRDGRLFARPVEEDSRKLETNLDTVNEFCRGLREGDSTIPVTLMLVPSSGAVLLEDPDYPDEEIIRRVYDRTEASHVDLWPVFRGHGDPGALYYRTDHHWTSQGAFEAVCAYRRSLGKSEPRREDYRIEEHAPFYGSAYAASGLWLTEPDRLELWRSGNDIRVRNETGVENDGVFYPERLKQQDMYPVFLDGNHPLVRIEKPSAEGEGETLLVIRDSFSNCLGCFLADLYDKVILVDLRYYKLPLTDLLLEEGVDEILIEYSVDNFLNSPDLAFLTVEPEKLLQSAEEERRLQERQMEIQRELELQLQQKLEEQRRPPNYLAPPPEITEELFDGAYYLGDSVVGTLYSYCVMYNKLPNTLIASNAMLSYNQVVELKLDHLYYKGQFTTLPEILRDRKPPILIAALGCNDLANYDVEHCEETVLRFLDMAREEIPDITIFIQSVMPIRANMTTFNQSEVDEFNTWLKDNAESHDYCYIELDRYFKGEDGKLLYKYMYNDTHIDFNGGPLWYQEFMNIENYYNFPEKYCIEYDGVTGLPLAENPEETEDLSGTDPTAQAPENEKQEEPEREETALDRIYRAICEQLSCPDMLEISGGTVTTYLGLEAEDYRDGRFYLCANNLKADEIWLIEAEDEDAARALCKRAGERIRLKAQSYDKYLPEESEIIRRGEAVIKGRYVALFISPDAEKMSEIFLAALG